ncbi:MAG: hypothetical protein QXH17_03060 [Candidatus Bathyarchaeia archaeon]
MLLARVSSAILVEPRLRSLEFLVDTGAYHKAIPVEVKRRSLGFK